MGVVKAEAGARGQKPARALLRRPRLGSHISDGGLAAVMVLPATILMAGYVVYPLWSVVSSSFESFATVTSPGVWTGVDNFRWLFTGPDFLPGLGRSIYYTVANIVLQTGLGLFIALLLNVNLPLRNVARAAILFPFIVPGVVAALIWGYLLDPLTGVLNYAFQEMHLIDAPIGWLARPSTAMNMVVAVSVWKYMPFMIILFLARLQTVPAEIVEAAKVDGAGHVATLRYIVLPWMTPVILVAVMLRLIWSFTEYDIPYLLTQGGPASSTMVLPVMIRTLFFEELDPGRASAVSVFLIAVLVLCGIGYFFAYRYGERRLDG